MRSSSARQPCLVRRQVRAVRAVGGVLVLLALIGPGLPTTSVADVAPTRTVQE